MPCFHLTMVRCSVALATLLAVGSAVQSAPPHSNAHHKPSKPVAKKTPPKTPSPPPAANTSPPRTPSPPPAADTSQSSGPSYDETVEYLQGRLETGHTSDFNNGTEYRGTFEYTFPEHGLLQVFSNTRHTYGSEKYEDSETDSIPLKSISPSSLTLTHNGQVSTISGSTTYGLKSIQHTITPDGRDPRDFQGAYFEIHLDNDMNTDTQTKILNALRHLVVLCGGKDNTPDPFANP